MRFGHLMRNQENVYSKGNVNIEKSLYGTFVILYVHLLIISRRNYDALWAYYLNIII